MNERKRVALPRLLETGDVIRLDGDVWIVTQTTFDGGGTGMGDHDVYPDGHHVWCKSAKSDAVIDFYQAGAFEGVRRNVKPLGKATAHWVLPPRIARTI